LTSSPFLSNKALHLCSFVYLIQKLDEGEEKKNGQGSLLSFCFLFFLFCFYYNNTTKKAPRPKGRGDEWMANNKESLALEHINSGKPTNSSVMNKIVFNQNILVTDSKLKEFFKIKGVDFYLPILQRKNKNL
jgi:hypothetical protein